jgi:hypothetical protein
MAKETFVSVWTPSFERREGEPIAIWGEDWFAPDKAPLTTL